MKWKTFLQPEANFLVGFCCVVISSVFHFRSTFLPSDACTALPSPAFSNLPTTTASRKASGGQPCQVCMTAVSNGLHFGAKTCAACAAFFRFLFCCSLINTVQKHFSLFYFILCNNMQIENVDKKEHILCVQQMQM